MTVQTLYEITQTRQNAYSFLASIFLLEPRKETILDVQYELNHFLNNNEKLTVLMSLPDEVESLCQEYYDLFFVPSSGIYIPPFESALKRYQPYKKNAYGQLFSDDALHVQSCYEAVGFIPNQLEIFKPLKELSFPDHIGFELAFMGLLCANELSMFDDAEKAQKWRDLQYHFLSNHLCKWITNFALALKNNTSGFYNKAGVATQNWIFEDLENLKEKTNQKGGKYA